MSQSSAAIIADGHRTGRPMLYSAREALVFLLVAATLIASAALPALTGRPSVARQGATIVADGTVASTGR